MNTINLKNNRVYTHYFDSVVEVSPADGQVSQVFDVQFEDNLTYSNSHVRFRLKTPTNFSRVLDFNMGTKKSTLVHVEHVTNCVKG